MNISDIFKFYPFYIYLFSLTLKTIIILMKSMPYPAITDQLAALYAVKVRIIPMRAKRKMNYMAIKSTTKEVVTIAKGRHQLFRIPVIIVFQITTMITIYRIIKT